MPIKPSVLPIHAYSKYLFILLLALACATGGERLKSEYSIDDIKAVVEGNLPGPLHKVSINGRVYQTKAFRVPLYYRKKVHKKDGPPTERAYARIYILGDRRPYKLLVKIEVEELVSMVNGKPRYVIRGRHREWEEDITEKLVKRLVKRNKSGDAIDDFRPF